MNGQVTDREAENERYDVLDDWVSTLGTAFLGVTLGCARCHDHKFDPIGTDDYYHLVSALGSTVRVNRNIDLDPPASRRVWADFLARHSVVVQARQKFEKERLPERAAQWLTTNPSTTQSPWLVLDASRLTSGGAQTTVVTRFQRRDDGAYVVAEANDDVNNSKTIPTLESTE